MQNAATILLILFTVVAFVDGICLHLIKYRLYALPASQYEHRLHTINAALFPFSVLPLFAVSAGGMFLWAGVAVFLATVVLEILDVFEERASRAPLGGLISGEYAMHFGMSGLRAAYTSLALACVPSSAWHLDAPLISPEPPPVFMAVVGWSVFVTGLGVAWGHLWLAKWGKRKLGSPSSALG